MPSSARTGAVHSSSRSTAAAAGNSSPRSRSISVPSCPKRIARQMFSSIRRRGGSANGTPSSTSRAACATQATISALSASDSAAVVCASQMRTSTVPKERCGRIDHHTCVYSMIELGADRGSRRSRGRPPRSRRRRGSPQRGKHFVKVCDARRVQPAVARVEVRRVGADAEQQREHRAQPVADAHGAVDVAHADVDVQRERVVAPRDVLQAVDDAAVVLGVDVVLLAVVGPRVGAGRAERDPARLGEREQPAAGVALAAQRVVRRPRRGPSGSRSRSEISSPAIAVGEHRVVGAGEVAQLLEARHEVERRGVEDGELLLEADGDVGRGGEELLALRPGRCSRPQVR